MRLNSKNNKKLFLKNGEAENTRRTDINTVMLQNLYIAGCLIA